MGQGESKKSDIDKYLQNTSRSQLLHQYGRVNVDSSEGSATLPKEILGDTTDASQECDVKSVLRDKDKALIDLDDVDDVVGHDNGERKPSKDLSENSFPSTSTDKILEDYAEYANELINAPYKLHSRYTSNETIGSAHKINGDTVDDELSAPSKLSDSQRLCLKNSVCLIKDDREKKESDLKKGKPREEYSSPKSSARRDLEQETPAFFYANVPEIVVTKAEHSGSEQVKALASASTGATENTAVGPDPGRKRGRRNSETQGEIPEESAVVGYRDFNAPYVEQRNGLKRVAIGNRSSVTSPCLQRFPNRGDQSCEEGFHDSDFSTTSGVDARCSLCQLHQPLKRKGAVVVEVVENGDSVSDTSTIYIAHSGDIRGNYTQLPSGVGSRNVGKAIDCAATLKGSAQNSCGCRTVNVNERPDSKSNEKQQLDFLIPFVHKSDHVSKIAVSNRQPHFVSYTSNDTELYDDVISKPVDNSTTDESCKEGSVKNLADKFEQIAKRPRENSPVRCRENSQHEPKRENGQEREEYSTEKVNLEEESVYEEFSVEIPVQSAVNQTFPGPKTFRSQASQTENIVFIPSHKWDKNNLEPLSIETGSMVFNKKNKKSELIRSRHKSDSSTSAVSDSSFPGKKSSGKWKKSKESKKRTAEKESDSGVVQQWDSIVTEYEEKYIPEEDKTSKKKTKAEEKKSQLMNREQYDNVRQVFNRGMVLPMKRAPPGLTAQEVESESGATDMSAHSWAAHSPRSHTRALNGYFYDDLHERTRVKQRLNEADYSGHNKGFLDRDNRMRLSSQSSQYTSDIPVFHSSRDQRLTNADIHRAPIHTRSVDHRSLNECVTSGYSNAHGEFRSSGDYSSLPVRRSAYASDSDLFPAHRESLSPRYSSYYHERPSSPDSYRFRQRDALHSGYSTTPEIQKRHRSVTNRSPARTTGSNKHERHGRSMTRSSTHLDRSISPRRSRAVSVPREVSSFHGYNHIITPEHQQRLKERSYSQEYLDYDSGPVSSHTYGKKIVKFNGKKSGKKSFDERAKGVVDDIIDEAIELLSPKYPKKKKSKAESRKSRSRQKNVVHTTNVFNEINEVNADRYQHDNAVNVTRANRDNRNVSDYENRRVQEERRAIQEFEDDLRAFRQVNKRTSSLRPAPLDNSRLFEYRSSIRPVPGSGVTRDGSLPPPRSAYRNYDYELSVGQLAHQSEETKERSLLPERSNIYSSDSEYSVSHQAHYRRARKPSRYPNVTFGPMRARSEENLLSEQRKSPAGNSIPRRPVQVIKAKKPSISNHTKSLDYDSEPENPRKFNAPTLTRGLVTKILHKLDQDVKRASTRRPKRPVLNTDRSEPSLPIDTSPQAYTSNAIQHTLPCEGHPNWTNLSSPSSYSPKTEASIHSPSLTSSHPYMEMASPSMHQEVGKVDLYLQDNSVRAAEAHARFKLYHSENQPNINMSIPQECAAETARLKHLSTINESRDEAKYGAFSNEQMIVADLVDKSASIPPQKSTRQVSKLGKLYGTQPDVSMNKQQTLNFFLFNQTKNESETPKPVNVDDDERSIIFEDDRAPRFDSETEMREYFINHKGTQTKVDIPSPKAAKKSKKKDRTKYIIVQQPMPQSPKQIETTHYITQQREIEKLPPEKAWREVYIQTDDNKKRADSGQLLQNMSSVERLRQSPPSKRVEPSVVEVQNYFSPPVITESRHMEKKNFELPMRITAPSRGPPPASREEKRREIPVMLDPGLSENLDQVEENLEDLDLVERELSEDEETVILETTEIEEKEQRIQMAIFEEYEFSHKRTEDGKTVSVGVADRQESEIPMFWTPDKFEVVVDKKKKKSTQVKETTQEDEHKKRSGPIDQVSIGQNSAVSQSKAVSQTPVALVTGNAQFEDTFTRQARDNLSALEKVLEEELAQTKENAEAEEVKKQSYEERDEQGHSQEKAYTSYEKVVPLPTPSCDSTRSFQRTVQSSQRNTTDVAENSRDRKRRERKHDIVRSRAKSEPPDKKDSSSSKITYTQLKTGKTRGSDSVRTPAYRDAYVSLSSAKPYTATRMYGRNAAISNNWKDRVREAENDPSHELNSHFKEQLYNSSELDLETGTAKWDPTRFQGVPTPPPPVSTFVGETHSEQSVPISKTHYERDADGNRVKVTEWEHKLTKTVEYPSTEGSSKLRTMSSALNELPEDGYIDMNLHETVVQKSDTESSEETASSYHFQSNVPFTEVTGETEVGRKAFHYDSVESTMKVDDGEDLQERRFLYDVTKARIKPVGGKGQMNGYAFGETLSTQL